MSDKPNPIYRRDNILLIRNEEPLVVMAPDAYCKMTVPEFEAFLDHIVKLLNEAAL